jgi:diguanylate cyclase (GGDEF)-like protein
MPNLMTEEFLTTVTRAVGVLLVAVLLLPLSRVAQGTYLRYWAVGWASLAVGLLSAYASNRIPEYRTEFLILYCLSEFGFAWLLWIGCHDATGFRPIRWAQFSVITITAGYAVIGPLYFASSPVLFSLHTGLLTGLYLLSLLSTRRLPVTADSPTVGMWVLRFALLAMLILEGLQTLFGGVGHATFLRPNSLSQAEPLDRLPDVLIEVMLAFGMVLFATDRMREQLQTANQKLQAAADELRHAAQLDGLTGLLNRLGFETMLSGGPDTPDSGCIAVLDLNNLKPLNDYHGHAAGDAALKILARCLRTNFRVSDPLFRIGGDEFVVVMDGCDENDLSERLKRIDQALLNQRLPRLTESQDIIVAWGVAVFRSASELPTAFQKADARMYERKRELKANSVSPVN